MGAFLFMSRGTSANDERCLFHIAHFAALAQEQTGQVLLAASRLLGQHGIARGCGSRCRSHGLLGRLLGHAAKQAAQTTATTAAEQAAQSTCACRCLSQSLLGHCARHL